MLFVFYGFSYSQMQVTITPLSSIQQTGAIMGRLAIQHCYDVVELATKTPGEVHDLVRELPYIADPKGTEWVQRPSASFYGTGPFRDCDDKAIIIGAYAELNKLPFRFVAVGVIPGRPHHVFCEILVGPSWLTVDATYPTDRLNMPRAWGHREVIFDRRTYAR